MTYKFVQTTSSGAQDEIDRYASMGWKVITMTADTYHIYIVFGKG